MNALTTLRSLVFGLALLGAASANGGESLRARAERGLAFVGKAADGWMAEKDCISCHHMGMAVWSYWEAERRGITIEKAQLKGWLDWCKDRTSEPKKVGLEGMAEFILANPGGKTRAPETLMPTALMQQLAKAQKADGCWEPGTQFVSMQRRKGAEPVEASTRWIALALGKGEAADRALAKLGEPNAEAQVQSIETLVWRLLLANRRGEPAQAAALQSQITGLQHADGGWSWSLAESQSDAFATGQTVHALHIAGTLPEAKTARSKGLLWLTNSQAPNGSWPVQSRWISVLPGDAHLTRTDAIYTFWASAWATLALLQTVKGS